MLRSLSRAPRSCSSLLRPALRSSRLIAPTTTSISNARQQRYASDAPQAISNPTLASIEKRWEAMPPEEQAQLWMQLRDRMTNDWHKLTWQEKKASYWIAFGNHGPRALPPPGENWRVFWGTMVGMAASLALFIAIRLAAKPPPQTMTKEWQEATNEYLKGQKVEPITGISSEGYEGKGYVQSK